MKPVNRLILILVLLSSTLVLSAQDGRWGPPPARKVEEFKFSTQGHVKMLLDGFFKELSNNPADQGHVIIYPKTERQRRVIEKIVKTHIEWRKFDATRVTIGNGPINADDLIQFWLVPPGAAPILGTIDERPPLILEPADAASNPYGTGIGTGSGCGTGTGSGTYTPTGSGITPNPREQPAVSTTDRPLRILSKPRAEYTTLARTNRVQGTVTLRIIFLANGTIGDIVPVTRLPTALTNKPSTPPNSFALNPK